MAADAFKDRQKGYEAKYKMDEEKRFKVEARRNRLIGEWAAGKLGLSGDAVKDYVKEVVRADFEQPGPDDVVRKVVGDFKSKNVAAGEADVRAEMERLYGVAVEQINKEFPSSL
jgi:hypothetical protein